jgi:hypothetical protein
MGKFWFTVFLTSAAMAAAGVASGQEPEAPAPRVSGHLEAAYHLNLSQPEAEDPVLLRSYDEFGGNSFLLHAAHLALEHSFSDQVSAVIEIDGGTDAVVNGGLGWFDVQEAYATWALPFGLSFTGGKFVTYMGIEVIEGPVNPTITRGFLYGLAEPFTHVGAKAHYAIGELADVGVGVVNGWDQMIDNNDAKTFIWRVGVTPVDEFWAGLSGSYGAERDDSNNDRRFTIDLTGGVQPLEMLTINFQALYGSEPDIPIDSGDPAVPSPGDIDGSWWGVGLQPVLTVDAFSAGLRFEYFADDGGSRTGTFSQDPNNPTDVSVWNLTVTPGYTVDEALQLRAEYRLDKASENIFYGESTQHTVAAAVAYMF